MAWLEKYAEVDLERAKIEDMGEPWSSHHGRDRSEYEDLIERYAEARHLRVEEGWDDARFEALKDSPLPFERELREADRHLDPRRAGPYEFRAEYEDGALVVCKGRHRAEIAALRGMGSLPMRVEVPDEEAWKELRESGRVADRPLPDRERNRERRR